MTQFELIHEYITKNKLHQEVNKLANQLDNTRLAMILIYYNKPINDDIIQTSKLISRIEKMQQDEKIKQLINDIENWRI